MRGDARRALLIGVMLVAFPGASGMLPAADAGRRQISQAVEPTTAPAEAPRPSPKTGTPAVVVDNQEIQGVLGKSVRSSAGEDMGRIVDVLINLAGQVRGVVIDFGGFLGVGSRKVAVDWSMLRFPSDKPDQITVELTRDQVRLAPEYKPGDPVVLLGAGGAAQPMSANPGNPPPAK
jgi:hypothetical protein